MEKFLNELRYELEKKDIDWLIKLIILHRWKVIRRAKFFEFHVGNRMQRAIRKPKAVMIELLICYYSDTLHELYSSKFNAK